MYSGLLERAGMVYRVLWEELHGRVAYAVLLR